MFVPIVHPAMLHMLLSLSVQKNVSIHQIDIKNAYLNLYLKDDEIIYIHLCTSTLPQVLWVATQPL